MTVPHFPEYCMCLHPGTQEYGDSLGLMTTLTFSKAKAKILNFLVNPVSAKETTYARFSRIHPSFPFKIMGLLETEMPQFCDF